jgi:hypothetical protein
MSEYWGYFAATFWYGILPLISFSFLNLVCAYAIAKATSIDLPASLRFGVSYGGIGIAVGLLTGLSRESAVGTVIPAVLTFLSGIAVYQFGAESDQNIRPVLPIALLCLILGTICAAVFGSSERNSYDKLTHRYEEWRLNYEKVELPIRREQLERELKLTPGNPAVSE